MAAFSMKTVAVAGFDGKENSVLFYCTPSPSRHVIYFPGDTQDLQVNMEAMYRDISQWSPWSLEMTRDILREKFPGSAIWIIRPHTLLRHLFSCFHNFVNSSIVGVPVFSDEPKAVPHLYHLLKNLIHLYHQQQQEQDKEENGKKESTAKAKASSLSEEDMLKLPLTIIGFSKGCVVLNQIVHELNNFITPPDPLPTTSDPLPTTSDPLPTTSTNSKPQAPNDPKTPSDSKSSVNIELINFVHQMTSFYWLDSGHSGEEDCWITDREVLSTLAALRPEVHVHVTPHQMKCLQRPWLYEEERLFVGILRELDIEVKETYHFKDEPRSLLNHFKVLDVF